MAITPIQDITVIKAVLEQDAYLNSLGYNSQNIYRYNQLEEEITATTKSISIWLSPSQPRKNHNVLIECIYSIKIVSTRNNIGDVSNAVSQIVALLQGLDIGNNHILELDDVPMELSSPKGTITYYVSFNTLASMYNQVKKPKA